jgi:hypothetical protein
MGRSNEDFEAGHQQLPSSFIHATNIKFNVGDVIAPQATGSLQKSSEQGGVRMPQGGWGEQANAPRAWATDESVVNGGYKMWYQSYAHRAESLNPSKEKMGYLYRVQPVGVPEKHRSVEAGEWSSPQGWRVTHVLGALPLSHKRVHWDEDKQELYSDEQRYGA